MNSNLYQILIPAVVGLVTGILGTFFAPWAKWRIEKRKLKFNSRAELIKRVRKFIIKNELEYINFRETALYSEIRPHINKELLEEIERSDGAIKVVIGDSRGSGVNNISHLLLDDLTRLEKKWKLI